VVFGGCCFVGGGRFVAFGIGGLIVLMIVLICMNFCLLG